MLYGYYLPWMKLRGGWCWWSSQQKLNALRGENFCLFPCLSSDPLLLLQLGKVFPVPIILPTRFSMQSTLCVLFLFLPWPDDDGGSARACKTFWCHDDEAPRSVVLIHVPSPQKVLFLAFREETQRKWRRKLLCFSLEKARPAFLIHLQIIFELYISAEITLICWFFSG